MLIPSAAALIHDTFPAHQRARAIGAFGTGPILGVGIAYAMSGRLLRNANELFYLPVFGDIKGWNFVCIILGLVGFAFPILLLTVPEPRKTRPKAEIIPIRVLVTKAWRQRRVLMITWTMIVLVGVFGSAWLTFTLPFFGAQGMKQSTAAFVLSISEPLSGLAGALVIGYICDKLVARDVIYGNLSVNVVIVSVWVLNSCVRSLYSEEVLAYIHQSISVFCVGGFIGLVIAFVQSLAPPGSQALFVASFQVFVSVGFFIGPLLVGIIVDGGLKLQMALLIVTLVAGLSGIGVAVIVRWVAPKWIVNFSDEDNSMLVRSAIDNIFETSDDLVTDDTDYASL
jgi:MFS family permease